MKSVVIIIALLLVGVVALVLLRDTNDTGLYTQAEAQVIAQDWVLNQSPTYTHDGMDLALVSENVIVPDAEYEFVFTFDSRAAGYGDRSDEMSAQVITPHEIRVAVASGEVVSAVTDGVYDEMRDTMIGGTVEPTVMTVEVYFMRVVDGQESIVAVEREVPTTEAVGRSALEALLAGPTVAEEATGMSSAINEGVVLQGLDITAGVATADFSARLQEDVAGSATVMAIREQIEKTLLQFETVNEVVISIDGEVEEILQP